MIKIEVDALSADALIGVIDDFVLREGTEYGTTEVSLEHKRAEVLAQLDSGAAEIWFDPQTESVTLRLRDAPAGR
ncbi:MAG: YheU family protein [Pseudomonadota bacterium]